MMMIKISKDGTFGDNTQTQTTIIHSIKRIWAGDHADAPAARTGCLLEAEEDHRYQLRVGHNQHTGITASIVIIIIFIIPLTIHLLLLLNPLFLTYFFLLYFLLFLLLFLGTWEVVWGGPAGGGGSDGIIAITPGYGCCYPGDCCRWRCRCCWCCNAGALLLLARHGNATVWDERNREDTER